MIKPLNDVVFLAPIKPESTSGLLIPNATIDTGVVVAISDKLSKEHDLGIGHTVKFNQSAVEKQTIDGNEYLMIRFSEIIAILN